MGTDHLYHKSPIDPEGLTSTLAAIAHTLIGFCCGRIILAKEALEQKTLKLFVAGFMLMACGFVLAEALPLNKRIWSPTFVLVTCGLAAMLQAVLIYFIDMKEKKNWCRFFEIFESTRCFSMYSVRWRLLLSVPAEANRLFTKGYIH